MFDPIKTKAEYLERLTRLETLMNDNPDCAEIGPLAVVVADYEEKNWPIGKPKGSDSE